MYTTQNDLLTRWGEDELYALADADADDQLDTATIERAMQDATDEINLYIGARYSLPLATVPGILNRLCVDMTAWHLAVNASRATELIETRYNNAIKTLKMIATGNVSLGLPEAQSAPTNSGAWVNEGRSDFEDFRP